MSDAPERIIVQAGRVARVSLPGVGWLFYEGQRAFDGEYILAPQWISVEDALPENDTSVLTVDTFWEEPQKRHFALHDGVTYWDSENSEKHHIRSKYPITNWMPLPVPPVK